MTTTASNSTPDALGRDPWVSSYRQVALRLAMLICLLVPVAAMAQSVDPTAPTKPLEPAVDGLIDLSMYDDPRLPDDAGPMVFHPRLAEVWFQAMAQENTELRVRSLAAFREAIGLGMTPPADLADRAESLLRESDDTLVQVEAVRLLGFLGERDPQIMAGAGQTILAAGQTQGLDVAIAAATALSSNYEPADAWFLERAGDEHAPLALRHVAVVGLRGTEQSEAGRVLAGIARDPRVSALLRLAAAESLASLKTADPVGLARDLSGGDLIDRQVAARALAGRSGSAATGLLRKLGNDKDPMVASAALHSLLIADPASAVKLAADAGGDGAALDPAIAQAYLAALAASPSADAAARLGGLLDHTSVGVRSGARETLARMAQQDEGLQASVSAAVGRALALEGGAHWRAREQAAILAGQLDLEAHADRLVSLLGKGRREERLAVAFALRKLQVESVLPAILTRATALVSARESRDPKEPVDLAELQWANFELTQLLQAIGQLDYTPADGLLRKFIPKNAPFDAASRSAAVWALGRIHAGSADDGLSGKLASRLADFEGMEPEADDVRRFAAISIGRIKAKGGLRQVRRFAAGREDSPNVINAARWAQAQVTGEPMRPMDRGAGRSGQWFLAPLDD